MRPYRRLTAVLAVLLLALLANLSWVQVLDAQDLREQQGNTRQLLEQYNKPRGPILVESEPVASSARAAGDDFFQRSYTEGPVFASATGYYSLLYGANGVERAENGVLSGNDPRLFVDRVQQLFAGRRQAGGAVGLTLDADAQRAAHAALRESRGAAVALDARTGAVLVLVSAPSFDPQSLAPNDPSRVRAAYEQLSNDPAMPLLNRPLERLYGPGATFQVVTVAAGLASGRFTTDSVLPGPASYTIPGTNTVITNSNGSACNRNGRLTLLRALATHCDTAIAWLGHAIGADAIDTTAIQFGFGASLGLPIAARPSTLASADAALATGIGGVQASTLQMALVAAAIANDGIAMRPFLVSDLRGPDLAVLDRTTMARVGSPMSSSAAQALGSALATAASLPACPGCSIEGRTVHALTSTGTSGPAVVIAYSGRVAVAVVVEPTASVAQARRTAVSAAMSVLRTARLAG